MKKLFGSTCADIAHFEMVFFILVILATLHIRPSSMVFRIPHYFELKTISPGFALQPFTNSYFELCFWFPRVGNRGVQLSLLLIIPQSREPQSLQKETLQNAFNSRGVILSTLRSNLIVRHV